MTSPQPPGWATQVPSAPVTNPPPKAQQLTGLPDQTVQAMQSQLLQAIWQGFLQIVDGFLVPDTKPSDQLATWWNTLSDDVNTALTTGDVGPLLTFLFGGPAIGSNIQVAALPTDIPPGNVSGLQETINTVLAELQRSWLSFQNLIQNVTGQVDAEIASLANWLLGIPSSMSVLNGLQTTTSIAVEDVSTIIAQQALNNKLHHAVDSSLEGVFSLTSMTGATPSTITLQQITSVIGFINIGTTATKYTLAWFGGGLTSLTGIYANVYSVNTGTGALSLVWSSSNLIAYVSATLSWVYVPITTPIAVTQSQVYALELAVTGSGTHTLVGLPNHWLAVPNPNAFPAQLGASRINVITPTYDATDAGAHATGASPLTQTESFTAPAGDDVFVFASAYSGSATAITGWTVTYGGTTMIQREAINQNATAADGQFVAYHLPGGGTGSARTISVTVTGTGTLFLTFNAVSYKNLAPWSATNVITVNTGLSTALSLAATQIDGGVVVAAFAAISVSFGVSLSSYSATQRAYQPGFAANYAAVVIGDSTTAGTITVTAATNSYWAGIAIVLSGVQIPAPATITSPTYSPNVPWIALSSQTGSTTGVYAPQTTNYPDVGIFSFVAPFWSTKIDEIGLGGGGAGQGEQGYNQGQGGLGGLWNAATLAVGTVITAAAGITYLSSPSATPGQIVIGATTQTVSLPTAAVNLGQPYTVVNLSSGTVTIGFQSSVGVNGGTVATLAANTQGVYTANVATPTTAGGWTVTSTGAFSGSAVAVGATITVTVGAGGPGGTAYFAVGLSGSDTTFTWTDVLGTAHTLTCAGGVGGSGIGASYPGWPAGGPSQPQNYVYNSVTYNGGGACFPSNPGNPPGGGGGGATFFLFGGPGAQGEAWVVARPS